LEEVGKLGLDIGESEVREGGFGVRGFLVLNGGFGHIASLVFEFINLNKAILPSISRCRV
jgi:hypothetical protein